MTGAVNHAAPRARREKSSVGINSIETPAQAVAEAGPVTAATDIASGAKKLWQYIGRNLEDLASNADFDAERNELYINDRLNNLFTPTLTLLAL